MDFPKLSGTKVRSLNTLQNALQSKESLGKRKISLILEGQAIRTTPKKVVNLAIRLAQMSEVPANQKKDILQKIQKSFESDPKNAARLQKVIDRLKTESTGYTPLLVKEKAGVMSKLRYETAHGIRKSGAFLRSLFTRSKRKGGEGFGDKLQNLNELKERLAKQDNPSPYELAALLGFNKSAREIQKELEKVPTRVNGGVVVHGEYEGDPEIFEEQLGLNKEVEAIVTPFTEAFSQDAGVWQGYSVGTHSMMVLRMFDEHLGVRFDKSNVVPKDHFRLFLMLHDIGKGLAVKEEGLIATKTRKRKELDYCQQAIDALVDNEVIPEESGKLFKALLSDVTIGKFLKGEINQNQAVQELKTAMETFDVKCPPLQFFKLARLFHLADASAYKALRSIPGLFEVNEEGKMRHAKTTGKSGDKLKLLKEEFLEPRKDLKALKELENLLKDQ